MFNLNSYIMKMLAGMVGKLPEFQVRQYALGWYTKEVLTEADLMTVEEWYFVPEPAEITADEVQ